MRLFTALTVLPSGDVAGDLLSWSWMSDGAARFDLYDADVNEASWVLALADGSGEVRLPSHNGGEVGCWNVDLQDEACAP